MDGERAGQPLVFAHAIEPRAFVGLSLKNGLLNLVTLTLYRFWGRTEVRRRIWAATTLNGEPFEYTGTGRELFLGFLIALAVTLPLLLLVFGAQFLGPLAAVPVILSVYVLLFWLMGAGVFLAFRYIASRTTWRGVRFQLDAPVAPFAWKYLGHLFLSGITMGWWWPVASTLINGGLWGRLRFGDKPFAWTKSYEGLFGAYAIGWFAAVVGYIVFIGAIFAVVFATLSGGGDVPEEPPAELILVIYAVALVFGVLLAIAFAPFYAALLRRTAANLTLDGARFALDVRAGPLVGLVAVNAVLLVLTLGFAAPYVQARTARFLLDRLSAVGTADLAGARQAERGPGQGEGLADAFGLSPI